MHGCVSGGGGSRGVKGILGRGSGVRRAARLLERLGREALRAHEEGDRLL